MPRLSTCSAIWILTLLLSDFAVTGNKRYPKRNISYSELQGKRSAHDCLRSFFRRRLLQKDKSLETVRLRSLNETSRVDSDQIVKGTHARTEYAMESVKRTLMDYNSPAITEDLDDRNDRDFTNHIRVKRNEPTNDLILHHQWKHSTSLDDSFSKFWSKSDAIYALDEPASKLEGSYANSYRRNGSSVVDENIETSHSRRKRGVLSTNGQRRKRVKGNGHAKRRIGIKLGKVHGISRSSRKSATRKTNSSGKSKGTTFEMAAGTIDESQIESRVGKRESESNSLNTGVVSSLDREKTGALVDPIEYISLINNRSADEQCDGNTVILPLVHTGRAELRVRIEKMPTNESSFVNPNSWTDRSSTTGSLSTALSGYEVLNEIADTNIANSVADFESTGRKGASNSTAEITPRKFDYASNVSDQETNVTGNTSLYNAEFHSNQPILSRIENDRNSADGRYDRTSGITAASADEDTKSRAKRNQEITSKRYLRGDTNATGSKRFVDAGRGTSSGGIRHEGTRYRRTRANRAARSIVQIKELAEKLIVKVNELQMYVSNHSETLRTMDSCVGGNRVDVAVASKFPSENSNPGSKIARHISDRQSLARSSVQTTSIEKRASQTPTSVSRFSRGEYRGGRKSRRKWGRWTDWSSCSVTCGKGRQIRWRHCLRDCDDAETEMEEKACQLPACPPGKFLGIF